MFAIFTAIESITIRTLARNAVACDVQRRDSIVHLMAKLKITVNKNKCIASGDCVETAPSVFRLDNDGKSEVANETGAPDGTIIAAARSCPVKAITIVNEETGEQLFPPPKK
jgi:ferredoxin